MISLPESELFKSVLSDLADVALEIKGQYHEYTDENLLEATLIFMEVFTSMLYAQRKDNLEFHGLARHFEVSGGRLHDVVEALTGVDLRKVYD